MNKLTVNNYFKMVNRKLKKRSPEILMGLGIGGMITTTVLAVKATPKALTLIEDAEINKKRELIEYDKVDMTVIKETKLTPVETVKAAWKPYVPAILLGAASVGCLIGSNSVHARRHAALYSAYKITETAYTEYKDKVEALVPEKKVKEIKQKLAEDKVEKLESVKKSDKKEPVSNSTNSKVIVSEDGDTRFVDPFTNEEFNSTTAKIDAAINRVNKNLMTEMFVSLSDLYDEIGLPHTLNSDEIGWCIDDGLIESDFSDAIVRNGKAYIVMDFLTRPKYGYDRKEKLYG